MDRYTIWEGHMDALKKKIKRIEKKCEKYGCDFHFEEVGEEFREVEVPCYYNDGVLTSRVTDMPIEANEKGEKPTVETVVCRFVIVEVEGVAIVNDWELIAYTEHTEKGNIYNKIKAEVEIPTRYRATDCFCEHCKTRRARKNTCIIRNIETDEFKQVGNTCLKDFTRGMDASIVTAFAEMKKAFAESEEAPLGGGGWGESYFNTKEILQYASETIRHFGYVNSMCNRPTKSRMMDYYEVMNGRICMYGKEREEFVKTIRKEMKEVDFDPNSEYAVKKAEDALAWIERQEASNDYMHNLKVVASLPYVGLSKIGILVSLFPTYDKGLEIEAERRFREEQRQRELAEGRNSEFVGEVGKRIKVNVINWRCVTQWNNCFDGWHTTTTYMYRFVDENGNILIWKTQNFFSEEKEINQIVGTVKEHSEFREAKQTVLTRCRIA